MLPCDVPGIAGAGGTYETKWTLWRERRIPGCDRTGAALNAGLLNPEDGGGVPGAEGDGGNGAEGTGCKTGGELGDMGGADGE